MKGKKAIMLLIIIVGSLVLVEALALMKLKLSVNRYRNYWERGNSAVVEKDEVQYIALGDSAAQGIGASEPTKGYVGLVADALAKQGKPVHVINLSVTGAKIQDAIDNQIPRLKSYNPDKKAVITLEIGANDMLGFSESKFHDSMDKLLSVVPPQTVVADMPYFGGGLHRKLEPNVLTANIIISELTNKYHLKTASLYEVTKNKDSLLNNAVDIFHPSNRGYRNWYEAFRQALGL